MRRLLIGSILLLTTWSLLASAALALGAAINTPPLPLESFAACAPPCWRGITPRETAHRVAIYTLEAEGYTSQPVRRSQFFQTFVPSNGRRQCRVGINFTSGLVITIQLSACFQVTLGDMIALLGEPDGIMRSGAALTFLDGQVIVSTELYNECDEWLTPHRSVMTIFLNTPGTPARRSMTDYGVTEAQQAFPWQGFATRARYQQTNAAFPPCA